MMQQATPRAIRRLDAGLAVQIEWNDAGHTGRFAARDLRLACPSAVCVDEVSGRKIIDPDTVPDDVAAQAIELVGAYGIRIRWTDGHSTGIYTFQWLLSACPCEACRVARA